MFLKRQIWFGPDLFYCGKNDRKLPCSWLSLLQFETAKSSETSSACVTYLCTTSGGGRNPAVWFDF